MSSNSVTRSPVTRDPITKGGVREKQTLQRAGANCASLGAIVTGVLYGMHSESADSAGLPWVAGSSHFAEIHWRLIIGTVLMTFGLAAISLTLREQPEQNDAGGSGKAVVNKWSLSLNRGNPDA
jgi:hypothetical protein